MKIHTTCSALLIATLLAASPTAFAQAPASAEMVPPGTSLPPAKPRATADEKAQGKSQRKQSGAAAAKEDQHAEGDPRPGAAAKVSKADRQSARADRKGETRRANKAGEITSKGEVGSVK